MGGLYPAVDRKLLNMALMIMMCYYKKNISMFLFNSQNTRIKDFLYFLGQKYVI